MNEIDYYELLGVEEPQDTPDTREAQDTETEGTPDTRDTPDTREAQDTGTEGTPDTRDADTPEGRGADGSDGDEEEDEAPSPEGGPAAGKPGPEDGRAERERAVREALDRAAEENEQYLTSVFAQMGLKDPYTGEPIRTRSQFDGYRRRWEAEQRRADAERLGLSEEDYARRIRQSPEMREAVDRADAAEQELREARAEKTRQLIEAQVAEIRKLEPTVERFEDLGKLPCFEELYGYARKGYDLLDAYKLATYGRVTAANEEAVRQSALNAQRSREHLRRQAPAGPEPVPVPEDVRQRYRSLMPGISDTEIQQAYEKYARDTRSPKGM